VSATETVLCGCELEGSVRSGTGFEVLKIWTINGDRNRKQKNSKHWGSMCSSGMEVESEMKKGRQSDFLPVHGPREEGQLLGNLPAVIRRLEVSRGKMRRERHGEWEAWWKSELFVVSRSGWRQVE